MQLNFLGEDFDERKCKGMCDNCRKSLKVVNRDVTKEAIQIIQMINGGEDFGCNVTAKQVVDILRGKTVKSNQIRQEFIDKYKGQSKSVSESDIRRIIL